MLTGFHRFQARLHIVRNCYDLIMLTSIAIKPMGLLMTRLMAGSQHSKSMAKRKAWKN